MTTGILLITSGTLSAITSGVWIAVYIKHRGTESLVIATFCALMSIGLVFVGVRSIVQ